MITILFTETKPNKPLTVNELFGLGKKEEKVETKKPEVKKKKKPEAKVEEVKKLRL